MKIFIITIVIVVASYFVFFRGKDREPKQVAEEQTEEIQEGMIMDVYNTYKGGLDDAKRVKAMVEMRNQLPEGF